MAYPFPSALTEAWLVDVQPKGYAAFILFPHLKMIPLPVARPEQLFLGVQYQVTPGSNGFELPVTLFTDKIGAMTSLGSGITQSGNQDIGKYSADTSEWLGNFGWEGDVIHPHVLLRMSPNACLRPIGMSGWKTVDDSEGNSRNFWDTAMTTDHQMHLVLYRPNQSSGYVFAGLTMLWSWGLDDWATLHKFGGPLVSRVDQRLQTITRNMLQAAEAGSFGNDCSKPIKLSYHFAKTGNGVNSMSMILKEGDFPGRWSTLSITQQNQQAFLTPDPSATAALGDWAVVSEAYNLFVVDVNGDGRADLIAKEKNAPGLWYVAINQDNSFQPKPFPWLSGWAVVSEAYNLFVADVNADGRADLIAKEKNAPGNWYVALNTGANFVPQPSPWLSGWAVVSEAYNLFVVDVNGDGRADLIAKEKNAPGLWYVAINQDNSFQPKPFPWLSGWAVVSEAYNLFVADVNADGRADLIAKEKNAPGNWYVALNTGANFVPQPSPWLSGWAVVSEAYNLFVVDVNADGRADLIAKEKNDPGNWDLASSNGRSFVPQSEHFFEP